jgi:NitT/TauT family transport system ATP-binding protein
MIELINLNKSFGGRQVIRNFSAVFPDGAACLMGDSGIGKTTVAHIILGLIQSDSGEVRGTQGKRKSCVFQENRLIEELPAIKNLTLICGREKADEALALLCEMGLEDSARHPVSTLSGGMKRRVAIARALIRPADIYLFDEPFKELDEVCKDTIIGIIKRITHNATSIFITHDTGDARSLDAQIIRMENGE